MIVKFFRGGRTRTGARSAVKYLLNERVEQGTAQVYKGDPNLTLKIINSIQRKWKFTSGVISFEESYEQISSLLPQIIEEFEKTFFPGLDKDQYNILYVLHTDKGRAELHFLIPRTELTTGKDLAVYTHKKDLNKKDIFQKYINTKYGLSNPLNPKKKESLELTKKWKTDRTEFKKQLHEIITEAIGKGLISSRDDIVNLLKESGIEILRVTKTSITILHPDTNKRIRLKGDFYEENFGNITDLETKHRERERIYQETLSRGIEELKKRLDERVARDAETNIRRYKAKKQTDLETNKTELREHRLRVGTMQNKEKMDLGNRGNNSRSNDNGIDSNSNNKISKKQQNIEQQQKELHNLRQKQMDLRYVTGGMFHKRREEIKQKENDNVKRTIARIRETRATIQSITENATNANRRTKTREQRITTKDKRVDWGNYTHEQIIKHIQQKLNYIDRLINKAYQQLRRVIQLKRAKMDAELERFKTEINLVDYLQDLGYELDKSKSSRKSAVLKSGGEVLIVSRNSNGHYVYFNAQDNKDSGTIIDFIQKRTGKNLGQVRKDLRAYLNGYNPSEHLTPTNQSDIREMYQKAEYFTNAWKNLENLDNDEIWGYFKDIRNIKRKTIKNNEFIKKDKDGNLYFAVQTENGITGIYKTDNEMKQKLFVKGSIKGIWANKKLSKDIKRIIVTETPIDSLSIQELNRIGAVKYNENETLHIATFGRMGEDAKKTLEKVFRMLPEAKIVIATDNDTAGEEIASEVLKIANRENVNRVTFGRAKDANEYLQEIKQKQAKNLEQTHSIKITR